MTRHPGAASCQGRRQASFPVTVLPSTASFWRRLIPQGPGGSSPLGMMMTRPKSSSQSRRASQPRATPRCRAVSRGNCSQLSLSTCSAGSRRGLCWKSASNLGFLFSALGDRPEGLSFKLFHTSFSKLSSQSKEAGEGEEAGEGGEALGPWEQSTVHPQGHLSSGLVATNSQPSLAPS